jgi:hypothetical protein
VLDALPDSENRTEHVRLRQRLESILGNPEYLEDAKEDSVSTFKALGLSEEIASSLFEQVHKLMISGIAEQKNSSRNRKRSLNALQNCNDRRKKSCGNSG